MTCAVFCLEHFFRFDQEENAQVIWDFDFTKRLPSASDISSTEIKKKTENNMKPEAGSLIEKTKKSSATISTSNSCLVSKPKRPLCGYNFFFQQERQILLANRPVRPEGVPRNGHGKMGFAEMARTIAAKWKQLDREQKEQFNLWANKKKSAMSGSSRNGRRSTNKNHKIKIVREMEKRNTHVSCPIKMIINKKNKNRDVERKKAGMTLTLLACLKPTDHFSCHQQQSFHPHTRKSLNQL